MPGAAGRRRTLSPGWRNDVPRPAPIHPPIEQDRARV